MRVKWLIDAAAGEEARPAWTARARVLPRLVLQYFFSILTRAQSYVQMSRGGMCTGSIVKSPI